VQALVWSTSKASFLLIHSNFRGQTVGGWFVFLYVSGNGILRKDFIAPFENKVSVNEKITY
jgi:hypothetical protein